MRIAVLISGQPRFLYEGSSWFKHKVFPQSPRIQVDYYCHFWDNGDPNLERIVQETFNTVKCKIENYDDAVHEFVNTVRDRNSELPDYEWNYVPENKRFLLYEGSEVGTYARNFWGMFLATQALTDMTGDLTGQYDVVIKTRSDVALNNMNEVHWLKAFHNMLRNPTFNDKMLAQWMYVHNGVPYIGDFCFISKPDAWYKYSNNIKNNCIKLMTEDKVLWKEIEISGFTELAHWCWAKTSMYSKTDWLSFAVVWPTPFNATLIREHKNNILQESFRSLQDAFNAHAANNTSN